MPKPTGTHFSRKVSSRGITLIELLLVAGVIIAGTAVVLGMAFQTQAGAKRSQAQTDLQTFVENIHASYGASSNYMPLSTTSAIAEDLFPRGLLDPTTGKPTHPWGGAVMVAGTTRDGRPEGSSFVITMELVPAKDCAPLASSLATGFTEIVINQISVGGRDDLDVARLSEACSGRGGGHLVQLYYDNPHAYDALPDCVGGGTTETDSQPCPAGMLGSISRQRIFTCPSAYAPPVAGPWVVVSDTCAPECVVPDPNPVVETRPGGSCPVGELGEIVEERTITYSCPEATGHPTEDRSDWVETSNTCAPECVAPETTTETQTLACPPGQSGEIIQERKTTWSCSSAIGAPVPFTYPWETVSNTCASVCDAPDSTTTTESRNHACPTGQVTPVGLSRFRQTRTVETRWSCVAHQPEPVPSVRHGPWSPTEGEVCSDKCVAPEPRVETQTVECPSGQTGEIIQSRTTSWSCPSPTGEPVSSTTDWIETTNTCRRPVACVVPRPETETNPLSCPQGWGGSRREERQRTFSCPDPYGNPVPGPWSPWREYNNCYEMCTNGDFEPIGMMVRETDRGTYVCSAPGRGIVTTHIERIRQPGRTCVNRRWVQPTSVVISYTEEVTGGTYRNPLCEDPSYWLWRPTTPPAP